MPFYRSLRCYDIVIEIKGQTLKKGFEGVEVVSQTFKLVQPYPPQGDQPKAIEKLVAGLRDGRRFMTLLGATGTGKTYTMAHVIAALGKPTLVLAPNKTLAGQLANEFRTFFPHNAVEYFVSYYDYYQPEAYVPQTDTYIEKDASTNDEIDKLRHSATSALLERRDVIVVASVSAIYGLGDPREYRELVLSLRIGMERSREDVLRKLVDIQYVRNDYDFHRGTFRVRGDVLEVFPASRSEQAIRIEFFGDEIERITEIDVLTGEIKGDREHVAIFPASHYVTREEVMQRAIKSIEQELHARLNELRQAGKLLEAQRLEQRTRFDLEMMREMGFCSGIENYSRHLTGRPPGAAPYTLLDYFPDDFLIMIDESHVTIPQLNGMYNGDYSRKMTLVEYGFRLPSAVDNRPLKFEEFEARIHQAVFVSATPGPYERAKAPDVVEQIIRPTGLLDPEVVVRPTKGQIDDLLEEVRIRASRDERVLITTLTKKMAEDLTDYLKEMGVRVRYMHSDIHTIERLTIIRDLRLGSFDVLVGINLLREGLDLPEVSLVIILDADKEGFLRSETSLIQTIGRAARNAHGMVILYADTMTESMRRAIEETKRRRAIQMAYNEAHGITPQTIKKQVYEVIEATKVRERAADYLTDIQKALRSEERETLIRRLEQEMKQAAADLAFERAAELRDLLIELKGEEAWPKKRLSSKGRASTT